MNKFEIMWNELKRSIEYDLNFHRSGEMQSLVESIHGETKCEEFLHKMKEIETKYGIQSEESNDGAEDILAKYIEVMQKEQERRRSEVFNMLAQQIKENNYDE